VTGDSGFAYHAAYRVRFDESTPAGIARTSVLLRYAQDIAWAHSESLGFDRAWYRERGLAWLVRAAELEVVAPIPMGVTLDVTTEVVSHRRVWARRRGEFRLGDRLAAWVHTDWVLIDDRGRISRIPAIFGSTFPAPETRDPLTRVELADDPSSGDRRAIRVRPHELDPMAHVNNAVYLDWLEEAVLAAGGRVDHLPRRYSLDYVAAVAPGEELESTAWQDGHAGWSCRIRGSSGDVFRARLAG
jgi:acyl-ACP thioesterase